MSYKYDKKKYIETILYIETDKGSGTGFMFAPDGFVITCAHVVDNAEEIYVRIGTDERAIEKADIIVSNSKIDLAVLRVSGGGYYCSRLGIADKPDLGDDIVILGFPFGAKVSDDVTKMSVSFTKGFISSLQEKNGIHRALLDISAKAGNSGSPVINVASGEVVGVLCGSILGGVKNREEVNYMIPISYIIDLLS